MSFEGILVNPRAFGEPGGVRHVYADSANGDDRNVGWGLNDPTDVTDAANWSAAVQSVAAIRERIPNKGVTYVHTRGDFVIDDTFPYVGYRAACLVVSYDAFTVIDSGTIAAYTAAPAKVPSLPEMTINWDVLVPDDATIRKHFFVTERDDTGAFQITKAGRYNPADASHTIMDLYGPTTANGMGVRLVEPTSTLTVVGSVSFINTYVVGYKVVASGFSSVIVQESFLPEYTLNRCGFGLCEIEIEFAIAMQIRADTADIFGTYYATAVWDYIADDWRGVYDLVPGPCISNTGVDGTRRIEFNHGDQVVLNNTVVDNMGVYMMGGRAQVKAFRLVDGARSLFRCYDKCSIYFNKTFCSKINEAPRCSRLSIGEVALSSAAGPAGPLLDLAPGSKMTGHGLSVVVFVEDNGAADRLLARLMGVGSEGIAIQGGFAVVTVATSTPYLDVLGGVHHDLALALQDANRGPGPLVHVQKGAMVVLADTATGDNSDGGGYGLEIRDHAHVEGPAGFALTGNSGAEARIYLGKKTLTGLPGGAGIVNDLPAGATVGDEELVSYRRR